MEREVLLKYIEGECTDLEMIQITTWLDSDPINMREYLALRKLHDITIWQAIPNNISHKSPQPKLSRRLMKPVFIEVMKIAAILIIAIVFTRYLFPGGKVDNLVVMQTLHVPAGQRAEITLEDGTNVWLNANTTLTFPNQFKGGTREVKLNGEGFFKVASNKAKPFIVKTQIYDIKVTGTMFNVIAYSKNKIFETSLLEGAVEVLKPNDLKSLLLKPNERVFLKNNQLSVEAITHSNHFLWKEGIISFEDMPFAEMANKLELFFDLKIEIKNSKLLKYRCTGKFRTKDGIEHILKVLQLSNKFTYKINEKLNTITIE